LKLSSTALVSICLIFGAISAVLLSPNTYWLYIFGLIGIFSIVGYGMALLIGLAGQISIGHAAFLPLVPIPRQFSLLNMDLVSG